MSYFPFKLNSIYHRAVLLRILIDPSQHLNNSTYRTATVSVPFNKAHLRISLSLTLTHKEHNTQQINPYLMRFNVYGFQSTNSIHDILYRKIIFGIHSSVRQKRPCDSRISFQVNIHIHTHTLSHTCLCLFSALFIFVWLFSSFCFLMSWFVCFPGDSGELLQCNQCSI